MKNTVVVWWHNLMTGIPEAHEAVRVDGPYVEYANGARSLNLHYSTREDAEKAGRSIILAELQRNREYAERIKQSSGISL